MQQAQPQPQFQPPPVQYLQAPPQFQAPRSSPKVQMPDKYDGKKRGQAAENWILDLEAYFVMKQVDYPTARDEIGFAMALMDDVAKAWVTPIKKEWLTNPSSTTRI